MMIQFKGENYMCRVRMKRLKKEKYDHLDTRKRFEIIANQIKNIRDSYLTLNDFDIRLASKF